jgi:hypothetical protein
VAAFAPPPPPTAAPSSLRARLATAGASGLAAMALCNAVWYSTLFVLSAGAARPAPGQGVAAAWRAAAVTLAYTYGASQLSKVPRSFAILALVPALDRGLTLAARGNAARARTYAFALAACCLAALLAVMGVTVLAWA